MSTSIDRNRLLARAGTDPTFRALLLDDPAAAWAEEIGGPLPEGIELAVVEETPEKLYLVLPSGDLDDAALDAVTGGVGMGPVAMGPVAMGPVALSLDGVDVVPGRNTRR